MEARNIFLTNKQDKRNRLRTCNFYKVIEQYILEAKPKVLIKHDSQFVSISARFLVNG